MSARRTADQIAVDRERLLASFGEEWTRAPEDARAGDVAALVEAGRLERTVRTEWDRQQFTYSTRLFGGAGVVKRRRAYYRVGR